MYAFLENWDINWMTILLFQWRLQTGKAKEEQYNIRTKTTNLNPSQSMFLAIPLTLQTSSFDDREIH